MIGQVTSGPASRARADQIDQILGETTIRYTDGAVAGLPQAWDECELIVSHLALGATTRIIAPLLTSKKTDPGVVVIDDAGRFVVPLIGGHGGGANDLARRLADGLGATAVLTTATDSLGLPALDTLGWPWSGDVAGVTRAILDGEPVAIVRSHTWPLPPMPANVSLLNAGDDLPEGCVGLVLVTDQTVAGSPTTVAGSPTTVAELVEALTDPSTGSGIVSTNSGIPSTSSGTVATSSGIVSLPTVVLNPPSLIAGMGSNRGTSAEHLRSLLDQTLTDAGLVIGSVAAITSVDAKADEQGLIELAASLGVPLVTYPAEVLAGHDVPNPSAYPQAAVGTPSVAEASVLARGAKLIVEKQRTTEATCAIGRLPARGRLSIVGIGPGARDLIAPRAQQAIREASIVVGYRPYIAQVKDLLRPGTKISSSPMGKEEQRTQAAIDFARAGHKVALISSGDPAIYAMASPTLEQGTEDMDVEVIPGVTASLAASAVLGAPLGHDHATISLSDLHTDWETIMRRLRAAAESDLVTVLYNPRSRKRLHHLPDAMAVFAEHRPTTTPVAVVEDATRAEQKVTLSTLGEFDVDVVNMSCVVVIGSSTTRYLPAGIGRTVMVTPRDYHWMNT